MKSREVILAPETRQDLDSLYDFIAAASSPEVPLAYVERIEAFCRRFELASHRGHRRDDVRPGSRITGFERRITVAFVVGDDRVTILRLFYGGRNWENLLTDPKA